MHLSQTPHADIHTRSLHDALPIFVKTKTPGVFKRIDGHGATVGYVAVIRVAGKQRKRNANTYDAARRIKRESETDRDRGRSEEHTSELQLHVNLVCRLLLEKKKNT